MYAYKLGVCVIVAYSPFWLDPVNCSRWVLQNIRRTGALFSSKEISPESIFIDAERFICIESGIRLNLLI